MLKMLKVSVVDIKHKELLNCERNKILLLASQTGRGDDTVILLEDTKIQSESWVYRVGLGCLHTWYRMEKMTLQQHIDTEASFAFKPSE
jgi:hypothetical protein